MMKPAFQPAPRPRPRISPEDAQQLAVATSDLGFTRPSSAPEARAEDALQQAYIAAWSALQRGDEVRDLPWDVPPA